MTRNLKILVVEDEKIIAEDVKYSLEEEMGHEVTAIADRSSKAIASFNSNPPDLVLMDINIKGDFNGIYTAKFLLDIRKVPIIFFSSLVGDREIIRQVLLVEPDYILSKPFNKVDTENAIKLVMLHFDKKKMTEEMLKQVLVAPKEEKQEPYVWLEEGKGKNVKVYYKDILWIQSQRNDLTIAVNNSKKYYKSQSLKKFKEENLYENFVQCQRSYIINLKYVEAFSSQDLTIDNENIPMGTKYRKDVLDRL